MARQSQDRNEDEGFAKSIALIVLGSVMAIFLVITLFLGIFKIDQYERGVVTRYGAFLRIAQPGVNFRIPWIDGLEVIDMRVKSPKFVDMESYSSDQQLAKLDISITLEPNEAQIRKLYEKHATVEAAINTLLKPYMPTHAKVVFGQYTSTNAIKERARLNQDMVARIIMSLGADPIFNILSVNVEDVEFSKAYVESVEQRMMAEVEVLKVRQNWEKAKVEADIQKTKADAQAYQIKAKGDAEAAAIRERAKALTENPLYIQMLQAEKWDGVLPRTVLPSTSVPLINLPKQ